MSSQVEVVFWDVQHGHSTYIKSPNDRHIVVDLGTGSYSDNSEFSPLTHLKNKHHVNQLNLAIITHPHMDHIDDIFNFDLLSPKILSRPKHLEKQPILDKARSNEKPKLEKYFEISDRYNQPVNGKDSIGDPSNFGGLKIEIFIPSECAQSNLNNHSVVSVFKFAGIKMLIPGDNESPSWNELKEMPGFLSATKNIDVLLASHHGRKSGFQNEIMNHFNPRITIVSDGRFCDTSATDRYSKKSRGWTVYKRNGNSQERKCLTTRNDGVIVVKFGKNGNDSFLNIKID